MRKKTAFSRGCPLFILTASLLLLGCPHDNSPKSGKEVTFGVPEVTAVAFDGQVVVRWGTVENATAYQVQFGTDGKWDDENILDAGGGSPYYVKDLENGKEYSFRVRAGNGLKWGEWSKVVKAIPDENVTAESIPAPENVQAVPGDSRITVSWNPVNAAYTVTYQIGYTAGSGSEAYRETNNTSFVLDHTEGIVNDTEYTIRVRAGDGLDWGPWSDSQTATPAVVVVAGAPKDAPSLGGETAFEVGGTTTVSNTVLKEWYSQPESDAAHPAGKDKSLLSGVIMIYWKQIEGAASYEVYASTDTARPNTPSAVITRPSYFHRDVTPDTTYYFWVRAVNDRGAGPFGGPYSNLLSPRYGIQTSGSFNGMIERADYPKNMVTTVTGEGSVSLSWDKSDRSAWYEVYYHTADISISPSLIGEGWTESQRRLVPYKRINELQDTATPWNDYENKAGVIGEVHKVHSLSTVVTGLDTSKQYYFWVRSLNHNGERGMAKSGPVNLAGGLAAPTGVQATPVSPSGGGMLKVSWNAVAGADGYRIYYSKYPTPSLTLPYFAVNGGSTTTYNLIRLDEKTLYYVWVTATSGSGATFVQSPLSQTASGVPNAKDGTEAVSVTKTAVWGQPLKNIVYIEVNDNDPRVALGYVLENTREQYFDTVIIFAANLRVRNCATEGSTSHKCTKSGPHIHYNGNVQHIFDNRDKYIKPLQDAGIKVLMGTLPDHDNMTYHTIGSWPFDEIYPWSTPGNPGVSFHAHYHTGAPDEYPVGPAMRAKLIENLCSEIERLGLDGFDMDDEWGSSGSAASTKGLAVLVGQYSGTSEQNTRRNQNVAKNIAEFMYLCRQRLGPDKVISLYRYGAPNSYLGTSGAMMTVNDGAGTKEIAVHTNIWNYASQSAYSMYGGSDTSSFAGLPRMQYSPHAIGFHNMSGPTNSNNYLNNAADPFGWMMFFDLASHANRGSSTSQLNLINRYAQDVYGQKAVYVGPDYPQDWAKW
jgi:hypothetical protein